MLERDMTQVPIDPNATMSIEEAMNGRYGYGRKYNCAHADLKDRVALITGGAGMIGFATAKLFVKSGAKVAIWDIAPDEYGDEVVSEIEKMGGVCKYYCIDISDKKACEDGVKQVISDFGKIDIFFGNGGSNWSNRTPVYDFDLDMMPKNIATNLNGGTFYLSKLIIPYMIKQGKGNIIFTSSVCGVTGLRFQSPFVASKFAVSALTRAMALEYGKYNIRVNCLCPGSLPRPSALVNGLWGTNDYDDYEKNFSNPHCIAFDIALRRPAYPDEMAGLVMYFASDDASYTTGQVVCVDGGWTAGFSGDM